MSPPNGRPVAAAESGGSTSAGRLIRDAHGGAAPPEQRRTPEVGTLQGSPKSFCGDTSTMAQTTDAGQIPRRVLPAVVDGQPADVVLDALTLDSQPLALGGRS